ncbi:hypothetical protein OU426_01750 [Frigidibacter sp. RF13]|uniref:hypothetical protein n=1 Tax=Frigidibacter sp. RF13 TaxID=2997340 RepID=UPI00226E018C|nr:hypothetical protein [Frigidibacter sp. RF13]MCY1125565.1 hypothetical protein [Frigidibacter sp. RF13]
MSLRLSLPVLGSVALLGACVAPEHLQPQQTTGFGAGATGYGAYVPAPTAQPAGTYAPATVVPPSGAANGAIPSSEINQALFGTQAAQGYAPVTTYPAATAPAAQPVVTVDPNATASAGLSDEQDFSAVSSRETIESDKARIEANKAQYVQIQPGALPERPGEATSAVVAYVLSAPNSLGQPMYDRRSVKADDHQRACQNYTSDESAQEAFLKAGGPKRDPKKLDPDGDGYACGFDPTPYRSAGN